MKKANRLLSIILCAATCISMLTNGASADDLALEENTSSADSSAEIADTLTANGPDHPTDNIFPETELTATESDNEGAPLQADLAWDIVTAEQDISNEELLNIYAERALPNILPWLLL